MTTFSRTTTALLSSGLLAAPVQAMNYQEGPINGYQSYVIESGSYHEPDVITTYGPEGPETIKVTCAPFDWESTGPNTSAFVDSIARSWCFS